MYKHKIDVTLLIMIVSIVFLFLVIPCGYTATKLAGSRAHAVPLPVYKEGTTFIYSNGTWETVSASSPGWVTWRNHRGYVSGGSPDFTRRRADWQTSTSQGTRQFGPREDLWIKQKISLWPLQIQNTAAYAETSTWRRQNEPEKTLRHNWSCEVNGTERIVVMAGEFDTWKIVCKRYSGKKVSSKSRTREIKTWYYAPAIGHYVLTSSRYFTGKQAKRLELLAVLPPLNGLSAPARSRMESAFQKAMEFKKSGQTVTWALPGKAVSGEITPTATFRLANGSFSRRYIQKLKLPNGQRTYYGMAVRDTKGVWIIPRN